MTSELSLEGSSSIRQRGVKVAFQTKGTKLYARSHRQRKAEHIGCTKYIPEREYNKRIRLEILV